MDALDKFWDALQRIPALLSAYESYSRPVLTVLLVVGLLGLVALAVWKRLGHISVPQFPVWLFAALAVLSAGGFFLKWRGDVDRNAFVVKNRFPVAEPGLVVFDFSVPSDADAHERALVLAHMQLLVHSMSAVLAENLPDTFAVPKVIRLPVDSSPWRDGITETNVQDAVTQLNAVEVLWGTVYQAQSEAHAKVSLGLRPTPLAAFDTVVPLRKDVLLQEDPGDERQFGDGRYEIVGTVCLGLSLVTYERALAAKGDERKRLLVSTVDQIARAREALNSRRQDQILQRTLYSAKVTDLLNSALHEAGVQP